MLKEDLNKLIKSLSVSEKRNFRLYCKQQNEYGRYASLFEIYLSVTQSSEAEEVFVLKYPAVSFDNTSTYLFKVLTDMLTLSRIQQDKWFKQVFSVMKAKLFTERSLPDRALKELKKTQHQAQTNEDHLLAYLCSRMELSQLARTGFANMNQQDLIAFQMKGKKTLQVLRQTHEHHSLYELLSHKLIKEGTSLGDKKDNSLDDLVLSELGIITSGSSHRFESRKLHLLFQAYFFIHKGDYRAALELFKQLNLLMEDNESILDFPPYDYLDTLEGILSSLISIKYYDEMQYFIDKIAALRTKKFPEHFVNLSEQIFSLYQMARFCKQQHFDEAIAFFKRDKQEERFREIAITPEKHMEYLLSVGISFFELGKIKLANDQIHQAINIGKYYVDLPIYRTCRLMYLIVHSSLSDQEFIAYEIRAYKRAFAGKENNLGFEKSFFDVITTDLKRLGYARRQQLVNKIISKLHKASETSYQNKILSYFDFVKWIKIHLEP